MTSASVWSTFAISKQAFAHARIAAAAASGMASGRLSPGQRATLKEALRTFRAHQEFEGREDFTNLAQVDMTTPFVQAAINGLGSGEALQSAETRTEVTELSRTIELITKVLDSPPESLDRDAAKRLHEQYLAASGSLLRSIQQNEWWAPQAEVHGSLG